MSEEKIVENKKQRSLIVYSNELLYKIADAGYLEQLNEVRPDRRKPNRRVYYFDRDPDLEKIIKDYQEERQKENAEKAKIADNSASSKICTTVHFTEEDRKAIIDGIVAQLKGNSDKKEPQSEDA